MHWESFHHCNHPLAGNVNTCKLQILTQTCTVFWFYFTCSNKIWLIDFSNGPSNARDMHSVGKAHLSPAFISQVDGLSVKLLVTNELCRSEMEKRLVNSWSLLKGRGTEHCVKVYLTVVRKWSLCGARMLLTKVRFYVVLVVHKLFIVIVTSFI